MSDPQEQPAPTCRHGQETCVPCSTRGTGIGRKTAFEEYVENKRIRNAKAYRGIHGGLVRL
jgi:hypothetical protein